MFKYTLNYINLIHLSKVTINPNKMKLVYYFDGRIEAQTFASQSDFDDAVAAVEDAGFLLIGNTWYNVDRLSIVSPNSKTITFQFIGNVVINHTYADTSEVDDVIAFIEGGFVEINGKWYQGKQIHVAMTDPNSLTIKYDFLGMDMFPVTYEDQSAFEDALDKVTEIAEGGGSGTKKVKTPKIMPAGGEVEQGTQVTITCATEGATIHYTTDGTTPTAGSPTYTDAFAINRTTTVKAIAMKTDMKDSSVATTNYIINVPTVATPTFSPSAGAVDKGTHVTITCATEGATIHYTTNGDTPTSESPVYDGNPIEITAAITLKAIGIANGMLDSDVATAAYTIKLYRYLGDYNMVDDGTGDVDPAHQITTENISTIITGIDWLETNVYNEAAEAKLNADTKSAGTSSSEWTIGSSAAVEVGYQVIYAYPASLGELTQITNNGFNANNSYTHVTMTFDGVEYLVYFLTDPTGMPSQNMKWSFN